MLLLTYSSLLPSPLPLWCSWFDDRAHAQFDLVGIYYGNDAGFRCPQCRALFRGTGPKWKLLGGMLQNQDWLELSQDYDTVMLADDDLIMSTHTLNEAFRLFNKYNLSLAQPSVCGSPGSSSIQSVVMQQEEVFLR